MDGSLLSQGLTLMLIGMGTVFVFLTMLVFATMGMSAIAQRLLPQPTPSTNTSTEADGEVVAAITAAIAQHRANRSAAPVHASHHSRSKP